MITTIIQTLYYFLFLFTPLIMSASTSELFEFDKMIFIYLVTVGISFFWVLAMIKNKKIIWKKTPLDIPIMLFLTSQILSTIFSIDRHTSFFGYYGRFNGGLLSIITYLVLFYGFINFFDQRLIVKLLKISLISSLLVILWGIPGRVGHDMSCLIFTGQFNNSCWTDQFHPESRMFSTLGQPNWLGAYLAINFFIGLYFLFKELLSNTSKHWTATQVLFFVYLGLNFATVLFTRSRSALASIGIGLIFFFVLISLKKKLFVLGLLLIIPVLLFKTDIAVIDKYISLPVKKPATVSTTAKNQASTVTDSFSIRKIVWQGAIELGKKYPLFGSGLETFAYSYYFVRPQSHNLTSEWDYLYNKAHNEYLNYFATTGYIGVSAYMIMIITVMLILTLKIFNFLASRSGQFSIFNKISKDITINEQILAISLLSAYLTILITNLVGFSTTTINLFFYLIPAFIFAWNDEALPVISKEKLDKRQKFWVLVTFTVTLFAFIYFVRYFLADVTYAKGDTYAKMNDFQKSANLLSQALQLKYEPVYEDKLSYVLANLAAAYSYNKQTDAAKKLMTAADLYNKKTLQESPKNVLYWKTKAKNQYLFYQVNLDNNQLVKGVNALLEAQSLAPTDPKIPYSLSIFYSLMVDATKDDKEKTALIAKSLQEADEALNLKPNYEDGYLLKGQLLKKYGKKEKAKQVFQFILDKINPQDETAKKEVSEL